MLYPSMSELLKKVDNRYLLVNLTAKRAREIAEQAEVREVKLSEKPVKLALDDIVRGRVVNRPVEEGCQEAPAKLPVNQEESAQGGEQPED